MWIDGNPRIVEQRSNEVFITFSVLDPTQHFAEFTIAARRQDNETISAVIAAHQIVSTSFFSDADSVEGVIGGYFEPPDHRKVRHVEHGHEHPSNRVGLRRRSGLHRENVDQGSRPVRRNRPG